MNRWVQYNPNPKERRVGDCAIRACCKATGKSWDDVYWELSNIAFDMADGCNSSNAVWGEYLKRNGFVRVEPDFPMDVHKFCCNFPRGTYVLGVNEHVVTVVDGMFYDTWDSSDRKVIYFWERG